MFLTLLLLIEFMFNWFTRVFIVQRIRFFNDESDNDGSGSGSAGTCAFPFCSDESVSSVGKFVGRVCGMGSGVVVPRGIQSISGFFSLVVFRTKRSRVQRWLTHRNILPLKILMFPPSFKISFGTIDLL